MPFFVKLNTEERMHLFTNLKAKTESSWNKIYPKFKISRTMFFNYLSGRYALPERLFHQIEQLAKIKIYDVKLIEKILYLEKKIKKPVLNSSFCELLGALNGDGHMDVITYEISIVGNRLEEDYALYLQGLFEKTFGLVFKLEMQDTRFKLRAYCKDLVYLLHRKYGVPIGNKMGKLKIPLVAFRRKKWLRSYLRGLFDTDGCFHVRREKDAMISIASADPEYLSQVGISLKGLGFSVSKGDNRVFIYKKEDVRKFFDSIKPANTKHLKKYKEYCNYARLV